MVVLALELELKLEESYVAVWLGRYTCWDLWGRFYSRKASMEPMMSSTIASRDATYFLNRQ